MNELKFEVKNNPTSEEQKIIRDGIIGLVLSQTFKQPAKRPI